MDILINKYAISPARFTIGVKGTYGIETLDFTFSDDWDGLTKKVSYYPASNGTPVVDILDETNISNVPQEMCVTAGIGYIVVSGYADGGNYNPVCKTDTDTVTIYAKAVPAGTITIPLIEAVIIQ